MSAVTLRICGPGDEPALRRLAGRDSARPLEGPVLVAEIDAEPLAAICLQTKRVIADPFSPTAALVALLHARAGHLARSHDDRVVRVRSRAVAPRRAPSFARPD